MTNSPQPFGFVCDFNSSEYACHVEAKLPEDAELRMQAMTNARLVGPLARKSSAGFIGEPSSVTCLTPPTPNQVSLAAGRCAIGVDPVAV